MAESAEWAIGYARQANADFKMFRVLEALELPISVASCHKLQFLQMACEKLVKAYLMDEGTSLTEVRRSHAHIASTLPTLLRAMAPLYLNHLTLAKTRALAKYVKQLAQEIEVLSPGANCEDSRRDNCEYPWEDTSRVLHVPIDWSFNPLVMLRVPIGPTILYLIGEAINYYLP